MSVVGKVTEKPGGARNVCDWDVHVRRDYKPYRVWPPNRGKTEVIFVEPDMVTVNIGVKFFDDASAREFEAKVRALLPEVEY